MARPSSFEIGFVLAGAVSAGCYSAGVMDFVIEALDDYHAERAGAGWDGPTHDVRVPVLAGASAGGMTAGIAGLHMFRDLAHVRPGDAPPPPEANRLYSSWVTDVDIRGLLATTDLDGGGKGLQSVLCSDALERILADAFRIRGAVKARPWIGRDGDPTLRVMMTLTNLRGVPYSFELIGAGAGNAFGMLNHAEIVSFRLGAGPAPGDLAPVMDVGNTETPAWDVFKAAALATGAFPIGLAPRNIKRPSDDFWTGGTVGFRDAKTGRFTVIPPDDRFAKGVDFDYWAVDGGTMNNEPVEQVRRFLQDDAAEQHDGRSADRALILVAPFPNHRPLERDAVSGTLATVLPGLFSALVNQARFKPEELARALDSANFSRFIVSPVRPGPDGRNREHPIASGAIGGFSGFLHESFRRHDYLLGRRNAQAFLRWNFALPRSHALFEGRAIADRWIVREAGAATGTLDPGADAGLEPKKLALVPGGTEQHGYPIIPLTPRMQVPIEIPGADVPRPSPAMLAGLREPIRRRTEAAIAALVDVDFAAATADLGWIIGPAVRAGARRYGARVVEKKAVAVVAGALEALRGSFP